MVMLLAFMLNLLLTANAKLEDDVISKAKKILEEELFSRELELTLDKLELPAIKRAMKTTSPPIITKSTNKNIKMKKLPENPAVEESAVEKYQHVDTCFDLFGTKKCQFLINDPEWKIDCEKDRMQEMCKSSCGYCGNSNSIRDCSKSKFGCCKSDGTIAKSDAIGSNCPECADKLPRLCTKYESDCNEIGMAGGWMRANCAKTCDICKKKVCEDDQEHADFCPSWKDDGLCLQMPELMKAHCKKTCSYC